MQRRIPFWDVAYLVIIAIAIPVAALHVTRGLYAQAVFTAGAAVVGLLVFLTSGLERREAETTSLGKARASMAVPMQPFRLRVVDVQGACPLGFQMGKAWEIDPRGRITPPLCETALRAIDPWLRDETNAADHRAACRCPLADARLAFAVDRAPEAA